MQGPQTTTRSRRQKLIQYYAWTLGKALQEKLHILMEESEKTVCCSAEQILWIWKLDGKTR